jgi:Flp pilus assembly protein TadB
VRRRGVGYSHGVPTASQSAESQRPSLVRVLGAIALAWGPGLAIGAVVWALTGHLYLGVITFAVLCLVMSITLGGIAASRRRKRDTRR